MIAGIISLLGIVGSIWLFYIRKKAKKKTPYEESKKDIEKFDDALVHGDADRVALGFDELFQQAPDSDDPGQHEADQSGSGGVEGKVDSD